MIMTSISKAFSAIHGRDSGIRECLSLAQERGLYVTYPFDDDDGLDGEIIPYGSWRASVFEDAVSAVVDRAGNVEL